MCGIYFTLCYEDSSADKGKSLNNHECNSKLKSLLCRRGPDSYRSVTQSMVESQGVKGQVRVSLFGSVLSLRGKSLCTQPYELKNGNLLLWNGEIFDGVKVHSDKSDTEVIAHKFEEARSPSDIFEILSTIQGPWSLVYWQKVDGKLWFGRDALGRRSLLWTFIISPQVTIRLSSVVPVDDSCEWQEIPSDGLYCLDVTKLKEKLECVSLSKYTWARTISGVNHGDKPDYECNVLQDTKPKFTNHISIAVSSQICIPLPIICPLNRCLPSESCKLWNSIKQCIEKLHVQLSKCNTNIVSDADVCAVFESFLSMSSLDSLVQQFEDVLSDAVRKRVLSHNNQCKRCYQPSQAEVTEECSHCSVAILFSGGLDSAVLALLANKFIPHSKPIDLLNVSFCHQIKEQTKRKSRPGRGDPRAELSYETPDRLSGRQTLQELQRICPSRKWNFVSVDVPKEELQSQRKDHLRHLIYPCNSVLDDSIGCAFWFATRGQDTCGYTCPARVVILGMGADEQLGGYSRHRAKFNSGGWSLLIREVALEIDRISMRNLGRDDRIVSDHGREARFPFLDESVVSFLNSLPVYCKCELELPRGIGDKLLLRLLAWKLGLSKAAGLHKRAIQFGSRIAKLESAHEKGSEKCDRLTSKFLDVSENVCSPVCS